MRNILLIPSLVCLGAIFATGARADFLLKPAPPSTTAPIATPPVPAPMPITMVPLDPPKPPVILARGFGHGVPLSFAVRQIVPPQMHVVFAKGVDETAPVDWAGGKGWAKALAHAVEPLGLRIKVTESAVTILRKV